MPRHLRTVECAECGTKFETTSHNAKFCPDKPKCRKAASRRPAKVGIREAVLATPAEPAEQPTSLVITTLYQVVAADLVELEALNTVEGAAALVLARRIESPLETGSAAATMTVQLSRLMDEVRRKAGQRQDGIADIEDAAGAKLRLVK